MLLFSSCFYYFYFILIFHFDHQYYCVGTTSAGIIIHLLRDND